MTDRLLNDPQVDLAPEQEARREEDGRRTPPLQEIEDDGPIRFRATPPPMERPQNPTFGRSTNVRDEEEDTPLEDQDGKRPTFVIKADPEEETPDSRRGVDENRERRARIANGSKGGNSAKKTTKKVAKAYYRETKSRRPLYRLHSVMRGLRTLWQRPSGLSAVLRRPFWENMADFEDSH